MFFSTVKIAFIAGGFRYQIVSKLFKNRQCAGRVKVEYISILFSIGITFAVRDSDFEGKQIKKGEILAMENGKLAFVEKDITKSLIKLTKKLIKGNSSYITVIYGSDVTEDDAQKAYEALRAKINDEIEIVLVNGGQPVYYYLISVE